MSSAVLEIDSREFHFTETDWKRTTDRHNLLTSLGFAVTHYPPSRVARDPAWADEVASWLRGRARDLGLAYRPDPRVERDVPPLWLHLP